MKSITVVIPIYNEEANIIKLHERLLDVLSKINGIKFELLFIDDHSTDKTTELLKSLTKENSHVRWIRLSRNSGSHAACTAGLEHCNSDGVVIMAADLQDPPEIIPNLLLKQSEGYQLVWAVRQSREGESWFTLLTSRIFYWLMNRLTEIEMPPKGADVLLADQRVVEAFRQIPERNLSLFVTFSWLGFRQASVSYKKKPRNAGKSKWSIKRKIILAIDSFIGFSYVPLRLMSYTGFAASGLGLCWAIYILTMRLLGKMNAIGYASIMITILILGGLQMVMLGVLGEYLWRTLDESRKRPRYFIESSSYENI